MHASCQKESEEDFFHHGIVIYNKTLSHILILECDFTLIYTSQYQTYIQYDISILSEGVKSGTNFAAVYFFI